MAVLSPRSRYLYEFLSNWLGTGITRITSAFRRIEASTRLDERFRQFWLCRLVRATAILIPFFLDFLQRDPFSKSFYLMYECCRLDSSHACITEFTTCFPVFLILRSFLFVAAWRASCTCCPLLFDCFVTLSISLDSPRTRKATLKEECITRSDCVSLMYQCFAGPPRRLSKMCAPRDQESTCS